MAVEHLQYPPVRQHPATNYCWAAGLSWWLKAVRKYNYSYDQIKEFYIKWASQDENDEGNWGALNPVGMYNLLTDKRWHLDHKKVKTSELTLDLIGRYLNASPVIIGYMDSTIGTDEKGNPLAAFHMNVIVCGAGVGDTLSAFMVMDPNYDDFKLRNLQYYKNTPTDNAFIAFSMNLEGKGPIIGTETIDPEE